MSSIVFDLHTEHAQALPASISERIPHASFLGIKYLPQPSADVRHVFYIPFEDRLVGNRALPALHGGAVAAFMESAALFHLLLEHANANRLPKIIDFNIDYLRAAGPRDSYCHCEVARIGRRVALVNIRCWQKHYDRPAALARAQYLWEEVPTDLDEVPDYQDIQARDV